MLGISAALWGGWLEHAGPRKAGFIAALCWGGGMVLGGVGVSIHQLWLVWLGAVCWAASARAWAISRPVSTLIKWFPDRRGMATGFAIMGYGGGAMIGAPIAVALMKYFGQGSVPGVAATLICMGVIYFIAMSAGAFGFRVPPTGWCPRAGSAARIATKPMITDRHVHLAKAWKTPQFWLIWGVLCLNVTPASASSDGHRPCCRTSSAAVCSATAMARTALTHRAKGRHRRCRPPDWSD